MNIQNLFQKIGIELTSFNSKLKNDKGLDDLLTLLTDKIGNTFGTVDIVNEIKKIHENDETVEHECVIRKDDEEYTLRVVRAKSGENVCFNVSLIPNNPQNAYTCEIQVRDGMNYQYSNQYDFELENGEGLTSIILCTEQILKNGNLFIRESKLLLGDLYQQHARHLISDLFLRDSGDSELSPLISRICINRTGIGSMEQSYNCHVFPLEDDNDFNRENLYNINHYSVDSREHIDNRPLIDSLHQYEEFLDYDKLINKNISHKRGI